MSWLFLLLSLVGAWLTYNTYQPIYAPPRRAAFSFFAGWLTAELGLHHLVLQAVVTLLFILEHLWIGPARDLAQHDEEPIEHEARVN